jgi:outer membrane protein OmpA-like peptidoglycan-associated protein
MSRRLAIVAVLLLVGAGCRTTATAQADTDRDGVQDVKDECPDVGGDAEGDSDGDGCPDVPTLVVESGRIAIRGKIVFELNSAELKPSNEKLLDVVARLLRESAQIRHVRIDGHTDDTGDEAFNQTLSLQRAEAVRAGLVRRGIEAARLSVKGHGPTVPLAPNDGPANRARNRRVELTVLQ